MRIDVELFGYRCFGIENPARFTIEDDIVSFVGANNAGKSTVLRFFYEFRQALAQCAPTGNQDYVRLVNGNANSFDFPQTIGDRAEVFCEDVEAPIRFTIAFSQLDSHSNRAYINKIQGLVSRYSSSLKVEYFSSVSGRIKNFIDMGDAGLAVQSVGRHEHASLQEAIKTLANSLYLPAFRNVVNVGTSEVFYDITIGQAFVSKWRAMKTGPTRAQNIAAVAATDSICKLLGMKSLEINASDDSKTLALIVDGKARRLEEVGSGTAQLILSIASAAVRRPRIILIDEPELNLHPSLQVDFLTALAEFASHGVIMATHSMGLARSVSSKIYTLTRNGHFSIVNPYESTPTLAEFLGSMSYAAYESIGFEHVLMVEGRTDVLVFHQWLRLLGLDHKVLVMPLGGADMINGDASAALAEVRRITPNVRVIIDSDRTSKDGPPQTNPQAFAKVCASLKIPCHLTELRATENYLPDRAVKAALGDSHSALSPFGTERTWAKSFNWKIARQMTKEELEATDVGRFLKKLTNQGRVRANQR